MMSRNLRVVAYGVLLCVGTAAFCNDETLTLPQYEARLHHYGEQLSGLAARPDFAVNLRREVPSDLRVQTPSAVVSVSMEFLHKGLDSYLTAQAKSRPLLLSQLSDRLRTLEAEAGRYEQSVGADTAARQRLERILSSYEFRRVRGPSEWELLQERVKAWLEKVLNRVGPRLVDADQAGQIFVWIMIAIASAVLAIWLFRRSREALQDRPREVVPFVPSAKNWRVWLSEACRFAAAGQWRDAIHFGFWAAVSRLEAEGVWRPDKARTPREYLAAIPAENQGRSSFAAITSTFERAWYGGRPSSADDFNAFLEELERLGCRA